MNYSTLMDLLTDIEKLIFANLATRVEGRLVTHEKEFGTFLGHLIAKFVIILSKNQYP